MSNKNYIGFLLCSMIFIAFAATLPFNHYVKASYDAYEKEQADQDALQELADKSNRDAEKQYIKLRSDSYSQYYKLLVTTTDQVLYPAESGYINPNRILCYGDGCDIYKYVKFSPKPDKASGITVHVLRRGNIILTTANLSKAKVTELPAQLSESVKSDRITDFVTVQPVSEKEFKAMLKSK